MLAILNVMICRRWCFIVDDVLLLKAELLPSCSFVFFIYLLLGEGELRDEQIILHMPNPRWYHKNY